MVPLSPWSHAWQCDGSWDLLWSYALKMTSEPAESRFLDEPLPVDP